MPRKKRDNASKERVAELKQSATMVSTLENTYVCDEGHWITTHEDLDHCLVYVKGQRCTGQLTRASKPKKSRSKSA